MMIVTTSTSIAFGIDLKMVFANASLLLSLPESSNHLILPISIAQLVQMTFWRRPVVLINHDTTLEFSTIAARINLSLFS